jgi:hypothetical protein
MSYLRKITNFGLLFFFIFAPRVALGAEINFGLLAVALIMVMNASAFIQFTLPKPFAMLVGVFLFLGLYDYCLAELYGNEPSYFVGICVAAAICVMFGWGFARSYVDRPDDASKFILELVQLVMLAILLNSVIMLLEYFVPGVKDTIESYLIQSDSSNIDYAEHPFRLRGFASSGGAALSIVNALGVMFVIFLVWRGAMSGLFGLLAAAVMAVSNIFAGRTGLIASLAFSVLLLAFLLWRSARTGLTGLIRAIGLLILTSCFISGVLNIDFDAEASRWAFEWVDGLTSGKVSSSSSDELGGMLYLPTNAIDLLFGVGFFEGESSQYLRSDSGYVKTVLSVGLLFGGLMYAFIGWLLFKVVEVSREYRWLVIAVLGFLYIVEIKEPFLYQNFAARVLFFLSGSAWFIIWQRKFKSSTLL